MNVCSALCYPINSQTLCFVFSFFESRRVTYLANRILTSPFHCLSHGDVINLTPSSSILGSAGSTVWFLLFPSYPHLKGIRLFLSEHFFRFKIFFCCGTRQGERRWCNMGESGGESPQFTPFLYISFPLLSLMIIYEDITFNIFLNNFFFTYLIALLTHYYRNTINNKFFFKIKLYLSLSK